MILQKEYLGEEVDGANVKENIVKKMSLKRRGARLR